MYAGFRTPTLKRLDVYKSLEAVDKIKTLQPQIVYLDIHMPQLKGIDAASIAPLWM